MEEFTGVIYQIRNGDDIFYVGQAKIFAQRMYSHFTSLSNVELYLELKDLLEKGIWPQFEIIESVPWNKLDHKEYYWIGKRAEKYFLYNVVWNRKGPYCRTFGPKKAKHSEIKYNKEEYADKISAALKKMAIGHFVAKDSIPGSQSLLISFINDKADEIWEHHERRQIDWDKWERERQDWPELT